MKKINRLFIVMAISLAILLGLGFAAFLIPADERLVVVSDMENENAVETTVESEEAVETEPETQTQTEIFEEYDISLMALGDNLLHMAIVKTGIQEDGTYDYSFLFDGIEDFLGEADIKMINQETIFGGNEKGFSGFPKFNSPTQVGDAIAEAGFNVVLNATNHAADMGLEGILNCVSFWKTNYPDMLITGIYGDDEEYEIGLITIKDITFAILNYTYGPNLETLPSDIEGHLNILCAYDETTKKIDFTTLNPKVTEDIKEAKKLADVVIVAPHWGTEYETKASSYQIKFANEMVEAGADLIIGTHPHVPQPVELITSENGNQALCYYSLGNYVSTQNKEITMLEEMAWVTFHVTKSNTSDEKTVEISMDNTGVVPMVCQYKIGTYRHDNVYLLEDYTEELASQHGLINYGETYLKLSDLQNYADEIFGEWILKKSDVLGTSDED